MLKHMHLLNILLLGIIIVLSIKTYRVYEDIRGLPDMTALVDAEADGLEGHSQTEKKDFQSEQEDIGTEERKNYDIIVEKNLFHPERRAVKTENKQQKVFIKTDIVLYGTIVSGDYRVAFVEDVKNPLKTPGRGRRQRALKIGDTLSGLKIVEIKDNSIVLETPSGERKEYFVSESSKYKHQAVVAKKRENKNVRKREVRSKVSERLRDIKKLRERFLKERLKRG